MRAREASEHTLLSVSRADTVETRDGARLIGTLVSISGGKVLLKTSYAGDLTIDRTRATVTRDGRPLNLTPTELRLLAFLAQHPGQVFSRGQLIENVWGSDADFYDDKTVSVHVRRLREKIEVEPGDPRIVLTVPGLGYRLAT